MRERLARYWEHPSSRLAAKLFLFLVAGLPGILVAIPLNYAAVTLLGLPPALVYAGVLFIQVSINFLCCRWFVFKPNPAVSLWVQYGKFISGILLFRVFDWGLYVFLVQVVGWPYLAVQIFNVILFAMLKFRYTQSVMEA